MYRESKGATAGVIAVVLLVVLLLAGCAGCFYVTQVKTSTVEFTVEGKERIAEDNGGKWLVFATDGATYQVTDNVLFGKTESTDRYRALEVGKRYSCEAVGIRLHFPTTEYKNLIDCTEVGR